MKLPESYPDRQYSYPYDLLRRSSGIESYRWTRDVLAKPRVICFLQSFAEFTTPLSYLTIFKQIAADRDIGSTKSEVLSTAGVSALSDMSSFIWTSAIIGSVYNLTKSPETAVAAGVFTKLGWNAMVHAGLDAKTWAIRWIANYDKSTNFD